MGVSPYLLVLIEVSKTLGMAAIFIHKFPYLKEWAYADFFFTIAGAIISHLVIGDSIDYPMFILNFHYYV
ncbi:DoxX family protein [Paenibacillus fonticola]|uniref:DoxX family protein n=1 Tax=Paenibacillus fonticola TaxID=379896 RepID=UPI000A011F7A